jgi:hypothetical protein
MDTMTDDQDGITVRIDTLAAMLGDAGMMGWALILLAAK